MSARRDQDESLVYSSGLEEFGGSRPSLFPLGLRREERLTSRLIATLELCRPFTQRFAENLSAAGRRPTRATKNLGGYRAVGVVEPRLGEGLHRADAALSLRYGTFEPWRCAFEVKYLNEGRNSKATSAKLTKEQVGRTYKAAHAARFDHVVTISADQPEGGKNPSGFAPTSSQLERTGLSHLSWLKVLWIIRQTRLEVARSLSPAEDRILADFETYLQRSNIWKFSREVSLGGGFATVRRACATPGGSEDRGLQSEIADVAMKWLQLTESVAQRLSIETDLLIRANGRRTTQDSVVSGIRGANTLRTQFRTQSDSDGTVVVELDLAESRIGTAWEVDVADLVPSRNPQTRTRWAAVAALVAAWPKRAYQGRVTVFGPRSSILVGPVPIRDALAAISAADESTAPLRIRIERTKAAAPRGTLSGGKIAALVERTALGMAPWRK